MKSKSEKQPKLEEFKGVQLAKVKEMEKADRIKAKPVEKKEAKPEAKKEEKKEDKKE